MVGNRLCGYFSGRFPEIKFVALKLLRHWLKLEPGRSMLVIISAIDNLVKVPLARLCRI
jgi:hypothetical protein